MLLAMALTMAYEDISFGRFHSRLEFAEAMKAIHQESFGKKQLTKSQILARLGPPDDRILPTEYGAFGEIWCYGTNGHRTLPTLGSVRFNGETLTDFVYSPSPPSPSIISETELRHMLRQIYRPTSHSHLDDGVQFNDNDPLELIRVSNLLIPLGVEKAVAILVEFSRLDPHVPTKFEFPYWISRIIFSGKTSGYIFPNPRLGRLIPEPNHDLSKWPTYPILTLSDLPIPIIWCTSWNGEPPSFLRYSLRAKKDWQVLDHLIVPPDDPFPLYRRALGMWVLAEENKMGRSLIAGAIIRSTRNAIHVKNSDWQKDSDVDEAGFESIHQKFKELKCRWNPELGLYVRGDGTFDADKTVPLD